MVLYAGGNRHVPSDCAGLVGDQHRQTEGAVLVSLGNLLVQADGQIRHICCSKEPPYDLIRSLRVSVRAPEVEVLIGCGSHRVPESLRDEERDDPAVSSALPDDWIPAPMIGGTVS